MWNLISWQIIRFISNLGKSFLRFGYLGLLIFSVSDVFVQKSTKIFIDYRTCKKVLPEFSFVGYPHGEKGLPDIKNTKFIM